jgi:predicted CXXCH cytochrome family protein
MISVMKTTRAAFFKILLIIALIVTTITMFFSCTAIPPTETKVKIDMPICTEKCHTDIGTKEYVHMPVRKGACVMCHKLVAANHPSKGKAGADFDIWGATESICYVCHERKDKGKVPHKPVLTGECTACHDPHQSDYPLRLRKGTMREICFTCHEKFGEIIESSPYVHAPVKEGKCNACHRSHGSDNRRILRFPFPEKTFIPFKLNNFVLCWECHTKEMVTDPATEDYTDFRNGDLNLHYKHVSNDSQAQNCTACHEIHSARQPKNMTMSIYKRKGMDRGVGDPDLKFTVTETGGSCEVSCHAQKSYDRVTPVEYK